MIYYKFNCFPDPEPDDDRKITITANGKTYEINEPGEPTPFQLFIHNNMVNNQRELIQSHLDDAIKEVNMANKLEFISELNRLQLVDDLQKIKQAVNAAFNYQSPADPPEGSPGQEDMG